MRLTGKNKNNKYGFITENNTLGVFDDNSIANKLLTKLGQIEDIEDNLPAFNGLQHLFEIVDLMETDEGLCFTYKGKSFVLERQE